MATSQPLAGPPRARLALHYPAPVTSAHTPIQAARATPSRARAATAFVAVQWEVRASGAAALRTSSSMGERPGEPVPDDLRLPPLPPGPRGTAEKDLGAAE